MLVETGEILRMQLLPGGQAGAWIACSSRILPGPGQFLLAASPIQINEPLAVPLFAGEITTSGFLALPPLPPGWASGLALELRGPMGRGFHLPASASRVALAALGETLQRLLPLAAQSLRQGCAVALFGDAPLPALPPALEAYPLAALPESLEWADYLALDLPLRLLPDLRSRLGLEPDRPLPCQTECLLSTPMPCAGMAGCGVCAVPARRSWLLGCKDGPVFDLAQIDW